VAGLQGVEALALGGLHALAVRAGGRVAAWGADQHGALGLAPEPPPLPAGTPALLARLRGEQVAQVLRPSPVTLISPTPCIQIRVWRCLCSLSAAWQRA